MRRFRVCALALAVIAIVAAALPRARAHGSLTGHVGIRYNSRSVLTDLAAPGDIVLLQFWSGIGDAEHVLTDATATLSLPPELTYVSHEFKSGNPTTVSVNGRTITVSQVAGSPTVSNQSMVQITTRVADLDDLPEFTPEVAFPMHVTANADPEFGVHSAAQADDSGSMGLLYSRVRMTSNTSGSVAPGEEVTYSVTTTEHSIGDQYFARLRLYAPTGTELVPGSVLGASGGTVTETATMATVVWGATITTTPAPSVSYRVKVPEDPELPEGESELVAPGAEYFLQVTRPYPEAVVNIGRFDGTSNPVALPVVNELQLEPLAFDGDGRRVNGELSAEQVLYVEMKITNRSGKTLKKFRFEDIAPLVKSGGLANEQMLAKMLQLVEQEGGFGQHLVVVTSDSRYLGALNVSAW